MEGYTLVSSTIIKPFDNLESFYSCSLELLETVKCLDKYFNVEKRIESNKLESLQVLYAKVKTQSRRQFRGAN